ncbi:MAG TPA: hypothetical protein VGZ26_10805 [Pirellulales bacterium]|nr:hypothetical protein [Pirellulales bacterium]
MDHFFMSRPFQPDEVIGLIIPACVTAVVALVIVTRHKRRAQRDEMEATLKMEMIERGMSADEIERVLAAKISSARKSWACERRERGNRAAPIS